MAENPKLIRAFNRVGVPAWHVLYALHEVEERNADDITALVLEMYKESHYPSTTDRDSVRRSLHSLCTFELAVGREVRAVAAKGLLYMRSPLGKQAVEAHRRLHLVMFEK